MAQSSRRLPVVVAGVLVQCLFSDASRAAQAPDFRLPSVWVEDYAKNQLANAVAAGKTTLILSAGSSLAVSNHVHVARYVAQRVADELNNALVLPITAASAPTKTNSREGHVNPAGALTDAVNGAIAAAGFRHVVVIADEEIAIGETTLETFANTLDKEWTSKGVRVYYVTAHEIRPGQAMTFNSDYLRRWAARTIPADRRKSVEDFAELLFVDRGAIFLRHEMIPPQDRAVVSKELGRILVEQRVSSILNQIRALSPSHVR
jgi:hypothetical protein